MMARKNKQARDNFEKLKREMTKKKNRLDRSWSDNNAKNTVSNEVQSEEKIKESVKPITEYKPEEPVSDNLSSEKITEDKSEVVVFYINGTEYALPVANVREIIRMPHLIKPPNAQETVKGMCNLRGEFLTVIDTELLLNGTSKEPDELSRIIVLENGSQNTGIISDKVFGIISIGKNNVKEAPANIRGVDEGYVNGIIISDNGNRVIILLNVESIIKQGKQVRADKKYKLETDRDKSSFKIKKTEEEKFILYNICDGEYGINACHVKEIIRIPQISKSLNGQDFIEGMFSYRNEIIPIINIGRLLGLGGCQINEFSRVIVISLNGFSFGILADKLSCIVTVQNHMIKNSNYLTESSSEYISKFLSLDNGKKLVLIIEPHTIIDLAAYGSKFCVSNAMPDYSIDENLKKQSYEHIVAFKLDNQEYAVDIGNVKEIRKIKCITRIPKAPYFIDGMTDLRGEMIPIMNLRKIFSMQNIYTYSEDKIIVAEYKNKKIGMLIDNVSEIIKVPKINVEDIPLTDNKSIKNYIYKIAKLNDNMRTVMILNIPELVGLM